MTAQKRSTYFNRSKSTWSFTIYTPTAQKKLALLQKEASQLGAEPALPSFSSMPLLS
jgi:hypothetical protein